MSVQRGSSSGGDEPNVDLNNIFSLRRPKDAKAGLASGLKSIGKGIAGGVGGLIAAPTFGAVHDGVGGFAKGVVAGKADSASTTAAQLTALHAPRGPRHS